MLNLKAPPGAICVHHENSLTKSRKYHAHSCFKGNGNVLRTLTIPYWHVFVLWPHGFCCYSPVEHSVCHIKEWLVQLMWNKKEMSQLDAKLTGVPLTLTFDLEFWRSNCISGMGGPIVMERKGRESIGCPDLTHNHYVTSRQMILLGAGLT